MCELYGYDLVASLPYILVITLEDYMKAHVVHHMEWIEGVLWVTIFIPPFALYSSEVASRLALDEVIECKSAMSPRVAP